MIDIAKRTTMRPMPCKTARGADRRDPTIASRMVCADHARSRNAKWLTMSVVIAMMIASATTVPRQPRRVTSADVPGKKRGAGQAARHRDGGDRAQAAFGILRRRGRRSRTPVRRGSRPCRGRARPTPHRSSRSSAQRPQRSGALRRASHRPASPPAPVRDRRAARPRAPRSRKPKSQRESAGHQPSRRIERVLQRHEQDAEAKNRTPQLTS